MIIFWRKLEQPTGDNEKKIVLERKFPFGRLHIRKYIERDLPSLNGQPTGTIVCLTRKRMFWRFRLKYPLQSTYFTLSEKRRWVQLCRTYH